MERKKNGAVLMGRKQKQMEKWGRVSDIYMYSYVNILVRVGIFLWHLGGTNSFINLVFLSFLQHFVPILVVFIDRIPMQKPPQWS